MPVFVLAVLACLFTQPVFASSVVVTPPHTAACKNLASYPSISQAVGSVPAGSTIFICPGTYAEQVVINKSLTLTGVAGNGSTGSSASGSNNPVVVSPSAGVSVNSSDLYGYPSGQPTAAQILVATLPNNQGVWGPPIVVNINNLTVDGSNNGLNSCGTDLVGIYYQNASGAVNHVTARFQELPQADFGCQDGLAIFAQSGYGTGTGTVTIENSSVHDYDKNGITADGSGTVATITGNYVVGIGATPLIAQNGIQMSFGASGKISNNTVTDDVYVNPSNCGTVGPPPGPPCYSATGILLYDSGGTSSSHVTISANTVSNTQGAIVAATDGAETADYNDVTSNKITTSPTAGIYFLDGIDLCSDHNTATSNNVFNSSGAGIHIDGECTEPDLTTTGVDTSVTNNTVNEACAGVLTGPGIGGTTGNSVSGTATYNVVDTITSGDTCPSGTSNPNKAAAKVKPQPRHR